MNWKRYFLAVGVTALLTLVADVLLNAVVFRQVYREAASLLRPAKELNALVPLGWTSLLLITGGFGILFARSTWRGLGAGLRFGALLAAIGVAGVAGIVSVVAWPFALLLVIGVQQVVNAMLLGAVFGLLYTAPVIVS
jgi:hypothetical protein